MTDLNMLLCNSKFFFIKFPVCLRIMQAKSYFFMQAKDSMDVMLLHPCLSEFLFQTSICIELFDPNFDIYLSFWPRFWYLPDFLSRIWISTGLFVPDVGTYRTIYPGLWYMPDLLSWTLLCSELFVQGFDTYSIVQ